MAFDRNDTAAKIIAIIADQLTMKKEDITEESSMESLGADSLDRVEIVMKIEEKFDLEINDDDADKLSTVAQAIDYVNSLRK